MSVKMVAARHLTLAGGQIVTEVIIDDGGHFFCSRIPGHELIHPDYQVRRYLDRKGKMLP